ncbi:hypothetical protein [Actinokineospora sp. NBRC 105648]|uniref:hypothetical protein n=1 Tax=Actinokineospora sp. NBRC 105648 TaxID=3032206 RepID=UPI0024A5D967|nr:hypothetical protein [Actinokineospora sp. NBRC 105648]GLZ42237.1 hypothetical protein Acsp05_58610 [Actinokineospora sp. NBRC 105648]
MAVGLGVADLVDPVHAQRADVALGTVEIAVRHFLDLAVVSVKVSRRGRRDSTAALVSWNTGFTVSSWLL